MFAKHGYECVVTSVCDSRHSHGSLHFSGGAVDFRTKHLHPNEVKLAVSDDCKRALGREFDVIIEHLGKPNEHLHVEWQPKVA